MFQGLIINVAVILALDSLFEKLELVSFSGLTKHKAYNRINDYEMHLKRSKQIILTFFTFLLIHNFFNGTT